jgi:hypothetical protein
MLPVPIVCGLRARLGRALAVLWVLLLSTCQG